MTQAPAAMTAARAAALLMALADLSEQQAQALEGDGALAVGALADQMRDALAELDAADPDLLRRYVAGDRGCRRQALRLAKSHAQGKALLPLAMERVARRRAQLSRVGVEWYGDRPVPRPRRGDLDISA
jgi:hypothetical protein